MAHKTIYTTTKVAIPRWLFLQIGDENIKNQEGGGGVVGARLVLRLDKWSYPKVAAIMSVLVAAGFLAEYSGIYMIMMIGGFLSVFRNYDCVIAAGRYRFFCVVILTALQDAHDAQ